MRLLHVLSIAFLWLFQFQLVLASDIGVAPAKLSDGWPVAQPQEAGLDVNQLSNLVEEIKAGGFANVHAVIVEYKGKLVVEQYWEGPDEDWGTPLGLVSHGPETMHDLRSVTKSVTSLLLGIALGEKFHEALEQPITSFFPEVNTFGNGLENVTLHHVLTMTAGIRWNEMEVPYTRPENDEIRMYYSKDPIRMVLERDGVEKPGERWYYNGGLTQVTAGVIERLTGKRMDQFAEEVLFGPLGIDDLQWRRSTQWSSDTSPSAASGLRLRARDLAKIASLVLNNGKWQGTQIVPSQWIETSTRRHVRDNPWGPPGVYGYGYFWFPGTLNSGIDTVRAVGNGDQRIFVLPELGISIVVLAGNYNKFSHVSGERIMGRILSALRR